MGSSGSHLFRLNFPFYQYENVGLTTCRALHESGIGSPGQFGLNETNFTGPGVNSTISGNALQLACLLGSRASAQRILNSGFEDSYNEVLGDADELLQNNAALTAYQAGDIFNTPLPGPGPTGIFELTPEDIDSWCDLSYVQHDVNLSVGLATTTEGSPGFPLVFDNIVNPSVGDSFALSSGYVSEGLFGYGMVFDGYVNTLKQNLLNFANQQTAVISSTVALTSQSTPVSDGELEAACKYGLEASIISQCEFAKNVAVGPAEFSQQALLNKALNLWCDGDGAEFSGMSKKRVKGKKARKKATSASSGTTVGAVAGVGGFVGGAMVMAVLSRRSKKPTTARKVVVV